MAPLALSLILLAGTAGAQTETPEIPFADLPDVAVTIRDPASPTGRAILFEPAACQAAGAACAFLMVHEHAHVALGHDPRRPSRTHEREADAWAAARAPSGAVLAAWDRIRRGSTSNLYGSGAERAQALCRAAARAGNWIGPPCQ